MNENELLRIRLRKRLEEEERKSRYEAYRTMNEETMAEFKLSSDVTLYSVEDVMEMTGWSQRTVLRLFHNPAFPATNYGKKMLVENHALIRFFSVRRDKELDPYWTKESEWD